MRRPFVYFLVLTCLGLLLAGIARALTDGTPWPKGPGLAACVAVLAFAACAVGGGCLAAGRGRSPAFGLLGLLFPFGLLFLCVLEDRSGQSQKRSAVEDEMLDETTCLQCGKTIPAGSPTCSSCGWTYKAQSANGKGTDRKPLRNEPNDSFREQRGF